MPSTEPTPEDLDPEVACPECGDDVPHRHCTNCGDKLAFNDEKGHTMQTGIYYCSPKTGDEGVHVAI